MKKEIMSREQPEPGNEGPVNPELDPGYQEFLEELALHEAREVKPEETLQTRLSAFWEAIKYFYEHRRETLYDTFLRDTDVPFGERKASARVAAYTPYLGSATWWLSMIADHSTYLMRTVYQKRLFPHDDKISDTLGEVWEPLMLQTGFKAIFNACCDILNKTVLQKHNKKIFYYNSFTRKDVLFAMSWYAALWVTSEFEALRPYHPFTYLKRPYTADKSDLAAYAVGFMGGWKFSQRLLSKFPVGRFADMERKATMDLERVLAPNGLSIEILENEASQDHARGLTARQIGEYKRLREVVKESLLGTSDDVLAAVKSDPDIVRTYEKFIDQYAAVFLRKYLTDALHVQSEDLQMPLSEAKLSEKTMALQAQALHYRNVVMGVVEAGATKGDFKE